MNEVVLLRLGQGLGVEGDWMPFAIIQLLGEDRAGSKVGAVGFEAEGAAVSGSDKDGGGSDEMLNFSEGRVFGGPSLPW